MNIISISDIHGHVAAIDALAGELAEADLILLAGDVTNFGNYRDAREIIGTLATYNSNILAVPGNCDTPEAAGYLDEQGINLDGRAVMREGIAFLGLGGSVPCPGRRPNEAGEASLAASLRQALAGVSDGCPTVLLCHQPPYGTDTDIAGNARHVGSDAVRYFIEEHPPLLCCTGHVHESPSIDTIGPTRIVNAGAFCQGGYAYARVSATAGVELLEMRHL